MHLKCTIRWVSYSVCGWAFVKNRLNFRTFPSASRSFSSSQVVGAFRPSSVSLLSLCLYVEEAVWCAFLKSDLFHWTCFQLRQLHVGASVFFMAECYSLACRAHSWLVCQSVGLRGCCHIWAIIRRAACEYLCVSICVNKCFPLSWS